MRLYSGTSQQFVEDNFQNQIAEKLKLAFFENFRFNPSPNEVGSWRNSLRAMSQVIEHSKFLDQGVLLEYQLPLSSRRLDCILCGEDNRTVDNAVIVELKQWEKCKDSTGDREVSTWVGGANRDVLHPSAQVGQYKHYLQDAHTAFYEGNSPVVLNGCSYLHNYNYYKEDILFSPKFNEIVGECPVFTADDVMRLSAYLKERVGGGNGQRVLGRLEQSKYRPSRKLMDHVGQMIRGNSEYVLLDEQLVVYDRIVSLTKQSFHDKQKAVVIVASGTKTKLSANPVSVIGMSNV